MTVVDGHKHFNKHKDIGAVGIDTYQNMVWYRTDHVFF